MPELNYIKDLLGIKAAEEMIFTKAPYKHWKAGKTYNIVEAKLIHQPDHCVHCGIIKDGFNIRIHDSIVPI